MDGTSGRVGSYCYDWDLDIPAFLYFQMIGFLVVYKVKMCSMKNESEQIIIVWQKLRG